MANRLRLRVGTLLVVTAALLGFSPAAHARRETSRSFLRGMCFTSNVFATQSEKPLVAFLVKNEINLVAIDFFLVGHNYGWTDFGKIARLVRRLKKEGVTVLVDYRPSTGPPGKASPGEQPDLCLSKAEVRANISGWGVHILDRVPGIDILTVYNPLPRFERNRDCPACRKTGERALLQRLFGEWTATIRERHPKVKLGAVFPAGEAFYRDIRDHLDVLAPFCSIIAGRGREDCGPGVMKRVADSMRGLKGDKPVIPLVKLYWKQATRNTTEDILHAMEEAKRERLAGFFLWYYSLLTGDLDRATAFDLPEYDLERIAAKFRELAGDPPYLQQFRRMRTRFLEQSRPLDDALLEFCSAASRGDGVGALKRVVDAAKALRPVLVEMTTVFEGRRVEPRLRRLHERHRGLLAAVRKEVDRAMDAGGRGELRPWAPSRAFAAEPLRLFEELAKHPEFLPPVEATEGAAYLASFRVILSAAREADRSLAAARRLLSSRRRPVERAEALADLVEVLDGLVPTLAGDLARLRRLDPPARFREAQACFEGALRLQLMTARVLPMVHRDGDEKGLARWSTLLAATLDRKWRVEDILSKISSE